MVQPASVDPRRARRLQPLASLVAPIDFLAASTVEVPVAALGTTVSPLSLGDPGVGVTGLAGIGGRLVRIRDWSAPVLRTGTVCRQHHAAGASERYALPDPTYRAMRTAQASRRGQGARLRGPASRREPCSSPSASRASRRSRAVPGNLSRCPAKASTAFIRPRFSSRGVPAPRTLLTLAPVQWDVGLVPALRPARATPTTQARARRRIRRVDDLGLVRSAVGGAPFGGCRTAHRSSR